MRLILFDAASRFERLLAQAIVPVAMAATTWSGCAQTMEPRSYVNTPVGMNFAIAAYGYSEGGLATDPSVPLTDAHLTIHSATLAYARSFGFLGQSCKADVIVPYGILSGDALFAGQPVSREIEGFADPRFRFSM